MKVHDYVLTVLLCIVFFAAGVAFVHNNLKQDDPVITKPVEINSRQLPTTKAVGL